jgi:hypothetical protein
LGNNRQNLPLSALLSQALVAYTIEFDNDSEQRMSRAGYPGDHVSLVLWANVLRFVPSEGISVGELQKNSLATEPQLKQFLGCLERWGFIKFTNDTKPQARRKGWGSGRGITLKWIVHLTRMGKTAASTCPEVWEEIEARWKSRFGSDYVELYPSLQNIADQFKVELPLGFPGGGADGIFGEKTYPPKRSNESNLPLSTLLSQVLLEFTIDFNQKCPVPLALCANTIRVLSRDKEVRVSELPVLTGGSSETSDLGWQIKRFVEVRNDPERKRGKVIRLSPLGARAQNAYYKLTEEVEKEWEKKFRAVEIHSLRASLEALLSKRDEVGLVIRLGLIPPEGVRRGGTTVPALGRKDVGPAAKQRTRDLVNQTQLFINDPTSLPHFPMWDANRGFGP